MGRRKGFAAETSGDEKMNSFNEWWQENPSMHVWGNYRGLFLSAYKAGYKKADSMMQIYFGVGLVVGMILGFAF